MKFLLSTGSIFHLPLHTQAEIAAQAGFDGLELILNNPNLLDCKYVRSQTSSCPVISIHAPFRNWTQWGGHLKAWQKSVSLAKALSDVEHITLHPPFLRPGELGLYWWMNRNTNLPRLLEAQGLQLSLENLPWNQVGPFGKDLMRSFIDTCSAKGLFITFDTCHLGVSQRNILDDWQKILPGMVSNIHFSDSDGVREHLWPGKGRLPLDKFLRIVKNQSYNGFLTLEVSPAEFGKDKKQQLVKKLRAWKESSL